MNRFRTIALAAAALPLVSLTACTVSSDGGHHDRYYDRDPVVVDRGPVGPGPGPVIVDHGPSRGGDWELLGRASVDSRSRPDHDVIPIGHREGRFKRLDFRVDGGDIEIFDMRIVYENRDVQKVNFRHVFDARGRTHSIDLEGDARHLARVEFSYRAVNGRPVVSLFGR